MQSGVGSCKLQRAEANDRVHAGWRALKFHLQQQQPIVKRPVSHQHNYVNAVALVTIVVGAPLMVLQTFLHDHVLSRHKSGRADRPVGQLEQGRQGQGCRRHAKTQLLKIEVKAQGSMGRR